MRAIVYHKIMHSKNKTEGLIALHLFLLKILPTNKALFDLTVLRSGVSGSLIPHASGCFGIMVIMLKAPASQKGLKF